MTAQNTVLPDSGPTDDSDEVEKSPETTESATTQSDTSKSDVTTSRVEKSTDEKQTGAKQAGAKQDTESDPAAGDGASPDPDAEKSTGEKSTGDKRVSISLSTLRRMAAVVVVGAIAVTFAFLYFFARGDLAERDQRAADTARAEQVASDYAVGAATIQYSDMPGWLGRLKTNTTPELANKFTTTAPKLEEILSPLKWSSTATPIAAKVMSEASGVYKVNVFLTVNSTNSQNPDGGQTTVTYNVTLDRNNDWKITDVGGLDGALPAK